MSKRTSILLSGIAGLALIGATTAANAGPITGPGTWSVWSANTPGANSGTVTQQGLPSAAPALAGLTGAFVLTGQSFTGAINFNDTAGQWPQSAGF